MEFSEMTIEDVENRLSEINKELDGECDIDALTDEVAKLEERKKEIAEIRKAQELRARVAAEAVETTNTMPIIEEGRKMTDLEVRGSKAYVDAFANYIQTEKADECRALLTENASGGTVPVPTIVLDIVRHAWENNDLMNRVRKTYIKGNVKIGFEISATDAVIHTEGSAAITPETLVLGIAEIEAQSIKKSIQITDEVLDLSSEAFLQYIYSELAYKIAKLAADTLVNKVAAADGTGSSSVPAQTVIAEAPSLTTIVNAIANLSDEAANPIIVMNKATYAYFRGVQANANFGMDIFEGLDVVFNSELPAYGTADEGDVYAIVGDFDIGALANFPNGEEITFKLDDKSLMKADLVEILGRMFVGLGIVAPKAFVNIAKPEEEDPEDPEEV